MRVFIITTLFILITHIGEAVPMLNEENIYKTLSSEWLVFDEETETYVPYLPSEHHAYRALHLILDSDEYDSLYSSKFLGIVLSQKLSDEPVKIFWNNQLVSIQEDKYIEISLDSIFKIYPQKLILLTLYAKQNKAYPTYLLTKSQSWKGVSSKVTTFKSSLTASSLRPPSLLARKTDWILIMGSLLVGLTILFSLIFYPIWGIEVFRQTWDYFTRPAVAFKRTEFAPQLAFVWYFGSVMGFVWVFYDTLSNESITGSLFLIAEWLFLTLIFGAIAFLKLFWIQVIGKLFFKQNVVPDTHTQILLTGNVIRMGLLFSSVVLGSLFVQNANSSEITYWLNWLINFIGVVFVIHSVIVSYYLFIRTNTGKLYLFSYLCATEILPLLIASKWVISI